MVEIQKVIEELQKRDANSEGIRNEIRSLIQKIREIHQIIRSLDEKIIKSKQSNQDRDILFHKKKKLEELRNKRNLILNDMHDCPEEIPFGKGVDSLAFYNP